MIRVLGIIYSIEIKIKSSFKGHSRQIGSLCITLQNRRDGQGAQRAGSTDHSSRSTAFLSAQSASHVFRTEYSVRSRFLGTLKYLYMTSS